jgi:hypothetical protein
MTRMASLAWTAGWVFTPWEEAAAASVTFWLLLAYLNEITRIVWFLPELQPESEELEWTPPGGLVPAVKHQTGLPNLVGKTNPYPLNDLQ